VAVLRPSIKPQKISRSRVEHCDGATVPLYYFEPEGPDWSNYQDDDGIELQSDAEALVYAYSIIRELKSDDEGDHRPYYLLVKNCARKTIFRIPFLIFDRPN
jgi:hypothetical protein